MGVLLYIRCIFLEQLFLRTPLVSVCVNQSRYLVCNCSNIFINVIGWIQSPHFYLSFSTQKQPCRGALRERCSKNIQQIYRTTPILNCMISIKLQSNFLEITLRHRYSLVNLLHSFGAPFPKNTSRRLLPSKALTMFKLLPVSSLQFSNSSFGMLYVCLNNDFAVQLAMVTAKNTVISPNYLVQKF